MSGCDTCMYADWRKTSAGRLHPDRSGTCGHKWKMPVVSAAFYFVGGAPRPSGGNIERGKGDHDGCPVWELRITS